jgi:hypothetical protein
MYNKIKTNKQAKKKHEPPLVWRISPILEVAGMIGADAVLIISSTSPPTTSTFLFSSIFYSGAHV